jgi:hypothetical protein
MSVESNWLRHSDLVYQKLYFYHYPERRHAQIVTIGFADSKPWELYVSRKSKHPTGGEFAELYAIPVLSNGSQCPFPIQSVKRPGEEDYTVKHLFDLDAAAIKFLIDESKGLAKKLPQHFERYEARIRELQNLLKKYETS